MVQNSLNTIPDSVLSSGWRVSPDVQVVDVVGGVADDEASRGEQAAQNGRGATRVLLTDGASHQT